MFKTYKEWLAAKGVSDTDYAAKSATEMASLQKEYLEYVSTEMQKNKSAMIPEIIAALKEDEGFTGGMTSAEKADFEKRIEEAEDKAAQAIEKLEKGGADSKTTMIEAVKTNKEAIKALVGGTSAKEIVLKADLVRAGVETNVVGYHLPSIGQLGVKNPGLYDVLPKVRFAAGTHSGKITYVDWKEEDVTRAAAVVAEGGTYPESTAKFKGYSVDMVKIGDTLPVTEEFGEDEATAAAQLEMFLEINVAAKRDDELVNGPGTAGNITGLVSVAPAFTPAASGIVAPNIYDLIKKVKTSITFNRGSKYRPDLVVMNDNTADELHLTKDANENYVFKDVAGIGPIAIIIDNNMADNTLVVGDRRFATIYEMSGVVLSKGQPGEQFVEDMVTLKARTRLLLLVRHADRSGFAKVTDIDAALVTLGQ